MPVEEGADVFRGRPLRATPRFAREIFYGAWPLMIVAVGILVHRRQA
jgi:hypothetical protein